MEEQDKEEDEPIRQNNNDTKIVHVMYYWPKSRRKAQTWLRQTHFGVNIGLTEEAYDQDGQAAARPKTKWPTRSSIARDAPNNLLRRARDYSQQENVWPLGIQVLS